MAPSCGAGHQGPMRVGEQSWTSPVKNLNRLRRSVPWQPGAIRCQSLGSILPEGLGQLTQAGVMRSRLWVIAYLFHAELFMHGSEFSEMIAGEEKCFDALVIEIGGQRFAQGEILVDQMLFGPRLAG